MRNTLSSNRQLTPSMAEGGVDSEEFVADQGSDLVKGVFTVASLSSPRQSSHPCDCIYTGSITMRLWDTAWKIYCFWKISIYVSKANFTLRVCLSLPVTSWWVFLMRSFLFPRFSSFQEENEKKALKEPSDTEPTSAERFARHPPPYHYHLALPPDTPPTWQCY